MADLTLLECIMYSLIGFIVVFGVLLLLSCGTMLMSRIIRSVTEKPAETKPADAARA